MKKKILALVMVFSFVFSGLAVQAEEAKSEDIVILYENDVHCEYSFAAEPPVQCGESHLSRLTEPLLLLC